MGFRQSIWAICLSQFLLVTSACDGNDKPPIDPGDGDSQTDDDPLAGRARIRVVHASPDAGAVTILVSTAGSAAQPLFAQATLSYAGLSAIDSVEADVATILEARDAGGSVVYAGPETTFAADKTYLVILAGYASSANKPSADAKSLQAIVLEEDLGSALPGSGRTQTRFVHAAFDAPQLALDRDSADALIPLERMLAFGEATAMAGAEIRIGSAVHFAVFTPDRVEARFTFDVRANERFTMIAIGSRERSLDAADGLRLILVPVAGTSTEASSPVVSDAAVYFMLAYPEVGPASITVGYPGHYTFVDQDLTVDDVQPTAFGQVTPRFFVHGIGVDGHRNVRIQSGSFVREEQLPEMARATTNVFVFTGFGNPSGGQQPLTCIGPIPLPPQPLDATASLAFAQAVSDADVLTFDLSRGAYATSAAVTFGTANSTSATGVPTDGDVTLDIAEASFTKSFPLVAGARHVVVSYGISAVAMHSFRCELLAFTANGLLSNAVTLLE